MKISTTFRDMPPSPGLQAAAERWVSRLEQIHDGIEGCQVIIERPSRHPLQSAPFQIRITVAVPDGKVAVSHQANKDAYVALADAFRAARRQLLEHAGQQRGFVKPAAAGSFAGFVASKA